MNYDPSYKHSYMSDSISEWLTSTRSFREGGFSLYQIVFLLYGFYFRLCEQSAV